MKARLTVVEKKVRERATQQFFKYTKHLSVSVCILALFEMCSQSQIMKIKQVATVKTIKFLGQEHYTFLSITCGELCRMQTLAEEQIWT